MNKWKYWCAIILIAVIGFSIYVNSLKGEFIWDDDFLVKDNLYIRNLSNIGDIFSESIFPEAVLEETGFYRPVQIVSYLVDYSLWKLDVRGYHLTNVLLHVLVAIAIFWLINILFGDFILSLFTSILFVAHPIHTEAVSYISSRSDSLAALFMLLCFIFYIKEQKSNKIIFYFSAILCYLAALLSRELSFILVILLLLYHYTFKQSFKLRSFLSLLFITFGYILLRFTVLKHIFPDVVVTTTFFQRLPSFFAAITSYLSLLLFPFHLHMEYGIKFFQFSDPKVIIGVLVISVLLIFLWRKGRKNALVFFSILWFFILLLPVSNLYPINAYMAEHWLYLPSLGFFLIAASGLSYVYKDKRYRNAAVIFTAALVCFYSYLTVKQNEYWRQPKSFYERTLKYAPDSARVYNNLGLLYANDGENEEAAVLYKKAIEIDPNYARAHNNIGVVYREMEKNQEAIVSYRKAVELNPKYAQAYNNLGRVYSAVGKSQEAIDAYKKAIEISPNYIKAYNNLGVVYSVMGNREEAEAMYMQAMEINSNYALTYNNLGSLYSNEGKNEKAISLYKKAIEIDPAYEQAYNNLGDLYRGLGRVEETIGAYEKAVEINPSFAQGYNNLGNMYNIVDRREEAINAYEKALEINPGYVDIYRNFAVMYYNEGKYDLAVQYYDKAVELGYEGDAELEGRLKMYRR
jgi:tetratricopeptide (TPR) repeat protein